MPTLDDAPILEALATVELDASIAGTATAVATQDLIMIYDVSQRKMKTITVAALMTAVQDAVAPTATTGTI